MLEKLSIYDIKRIYEEKHGGYYFSRKTMKFFGQTMRSFSVIRNFKEGVYTIRANRWSTVNGVKKFMGVTEATFYPETGEIKSN